MPITKQQLSAIAPTLKGTKLDTYVKCINDTFTEFNIDTPAEQAMFIAQIMHESAACYYTKEIASGKAYEGRKDLGNVNPGDGVKFKGRGLIQITGRSNYTSLSNEFDMDFITNPHLLETPEWAAKSAGWFWSWKKLGQLAKPNTDAAFLAVTKRINGGTNGLDDRRMYWQRAKKALGVA